MSTVTSLTGAMPRPEELVEATRDLDRGRTTPEAVAAIYVRTESSIAALEDRLGLELRTGGYLRWQDLFRPFAETWEGFTVGPLTRWFETNQFYRQPILNAPPARVPGAITGLLPPLAGAAGPRKSILPGPYTWAGLTDNRSGETVEALTHRLGRLLAEEVHDLRGAGYSAFQFQEPLLVTQPPDGSRAEAVVAAYRAIAGAVDGSATAVWTYFGDGQAAWPLLRRLPVTVVGVDLSETDALRLAPATDRRGLGLGVLDPRTSLLEEPEEVVRLVRSITERHRPTELWLGAGAPLDLLPWDAATRKLELLPALRHGLASSGGAA